MRPIFNYIVGAKVASSSISRDRVNHPSSSFNDKSIVWGAVGINDFPLWHSQWLLQVPFTFVFKKTLEVEIILFLPRKMVRVPLFSKKSLLDIILSCFWNARLSWISQWGKPYNVFHMIVDLCQVLNPCSARLQNSEVDLMTNQEGDRWTSRCWKPMVNLKAYISIVIITSVQEDFGA